MKFIKYIVGIFVIILMFVGITYANNEQEIDIFQLETSDKEYQLSLIATSLPNLFLNETHCELELHNIDEFVFSYPIDIQEIDIEKISNYFEVTWNCDYVEVLITDSINNKQLIINFDGTYEEYDLTQEDYE